MKENIKIIGIVVLFILSVAGLMLVVQTASLAQEVGNQYQTGGLTTPQLIEAALASGKIDQNTANLYLAYALSDYEELPLQYRSDVAWGGTLPLLRLQEAVKIMNASPTRTTIERILTGTCSTSTGSLANTRNSTHYHIQYGTISGGLDINAYETSLETSWTTEVDTFGWAAPPVLSSNPPPGNLYHVRIDNLGGGLYGYVSSSGDHAGFVGNNPNTTWNDSDAYASCMVLNQDYSGFPGSSQQALDATTAHEFNHSIQFGYGGLAGANEPDSAFVEGGATWMEDEVFDSANDNYNYLWPTFSTCMGEYTPSPYPYWITWRGLTERYGTGAASAGEQVMQDFWEETSKNTGSNLAAMNTALGNAGTNLADAYHAYAVAVKFNKSCSGGYTLPYCFEEGASYVSAAGATSVHGAISSVGGSYNGSIQDNYALNWVSLPTSGGVYTVTLSNTSSGGQLRGSVVCDTGSTLNVNALSSVAGAGGSSSLANFNPAGCTSVVAVITNQSQTADNPSSCTARSYTLSAGGGGSPGNYYIYLPVILKSQEIVALTNGNFESGATGWTEYSTHGWDIILNASSLPVTPRSGSWAAWLGGDYDDISYIEQQVTVPASTPYLSYWHWIGSDDACGYDFGGVIINGSTVDVYNLCSSANTGGWVQHVVNLSAYAGQNVTMQIRAETDSSLNSNLFVDDVSFQSSASIVPGNPPAFTPNATWPKSKLMTPENGAETSEIEPLLRP